MDTALLRYLRCPLHPDEGRLRILPIRQRSQSQSRTCSCDIELECQICGNVYPVINGIPDMLVRNSGQMFLIKEQKQWDLHAEIYDDKREIDPSYMAGIKAVIESINLQKEDCVLDVGCGTGLTIRNYLTNPLQIIAFDLFMRSLHYLKHKVRNDSLYLVRGDMSLMPFADETFNKVICANAIQHVPAEELRKKCIKELSRVAQPLARVVISAHNFSKSKKHRGWKKEGPSGSYSGEVQYIYRFELSEFQSLLSSAFIVVKVIGSGLPLPYRYKIPSLSYLIESYLCKLKYFAKKAHLLIGVCHKV